MFFSECASENRKWGIRAIWRFIYCISFICLCLLVCFLVFCVTVYICFVFVCLFLCLDHRHFWKPGLEEGGNLKIFLFICFCLFVCCLIEWLIYLTALIVSASEGPGLEMGLYSFAVPLFFVITFNCLFDFFFFFFICASANQRSKKGWGSIKIGRERNLHFINLYLYLLNYSFAA